MFFQIIVWRHNIDKPFDDTNFIESLQVRNVIANPRFGNVIDISKGIYKKTTPDLSIVKRLGGSRGAKTQQVRG